MRREYRLRSNADFQRVRRTGKSVANSYLVILHAPHPNVKTRFGFSIGKKLGGAVERNRLKRRLREQIRRYLEADRLRPGLDVVIIARTGAREADAATVRRALAELIGRAGLWKDRQ
ncbi:MAG: ribonuclease P protein component [Ardenticatenaceae bacterium]